MVFSRCRDIERVSNRCQRCQKKTHGAIPTAMFGNKISNFKTFASTDFCVRNLEQKIDQLRIPESEKGNIKKLIPIKCRLMNAE